MDNTSSPIKQLARLKDLSSDPETDQAEIVKRVQEIFLEAGYERFPYNFRFQGLYRASINDNESWFYDENGKPDLDKLHCPPDAVAKRPGRCNMPYEPVFYCSTDSGVPVFEIRAQPKQTVVISTWIDARNSAEKYYPVSAMAIAIGVSKLVDSMVEGDPNRALLMKDDVFKATTPQAIKDIDMYVGDLFCEPVGDDKTLYRLTSAIAYVLLNNLKTPQTGAGLHALLYPSIESKFSGQNIALHKEFARQRLKLIGATMYMVEEYDQQLSRFSLKPIKGLSNDRNDHSPIYRRFHKRHADERYVITPETPIIPISDFVPFDYEDDENKDLWARAVHEAAHFVVAVAGYEYDGIKVGFSERDEKDIPTLMTLVADKNKGGSVEADSNNDLDDIDKLTKQRLSWVLVRLLAGYAAETKYNLSPLYKSKKKMNAVFVDCGDKLYHSYDFCKVARSLHKFIDNNIESDFTYFDYLFINNALMFWQQTVKIMAMPMIRKAIKKAARKLLEEKTLNKQQIRILRNELKVMGLHKFFIPLPTIDMKNVKPNYF